MAISIDNSLTRIANPQESVYSGETNSRARAQRDGASSETSPTDSSSGSQDSQQTRVTISEDALRKAGLIKDQPKTEKAGAPAEKDKAEPAAGKSKSASTSQASEEVANMKRRDTEVRVHEQAHVSVGGSLVRGAANFGYATGPDGQQYAVSGEVSIDASPVPDDPQATISKMAQVARAALAPAQPSGPDRAIASAAAKMEADARGQLSQQQMAKMQGSAKSGESVPAGVPEAPKTEPEPQKKPAEPQDAPIPSPFTASQPGAPEAKPADGKEKSKELASPSVQRNTPKTKSVASRYTTDALSYTASQSNSPKQTTTPPKHINIWA
jgi:hypothetical protein